MIRSILAAAIDTVAVGALAYGAFRLGIAAAPCRDQGECVILTPLVLTCLVVAVIAYFAAGYLLFHSTIGQRAARTGVLN